MIRHDQRTDAASLRSYLEERVSLFDRNSNDAPGSPDDDIALIQIGFEHEQSGYVAVVFDTRPGAVPDGEWTLHIESENNWIEFPRWGEMTMHSCEQLESGRTEEAKITFITMIGSERLFDWHHGDSCDYAAIFGEMIKKVVLTARDDGVFRDLPLTDDCQICIEMINGLYAWPESNDVIEPALPDKNS